MSIGLGVSQAPIAGTGGTVSTTKTITAGSTVVLIIGDATGTLGTPTATGYTFAQDTNSPRADSSNAWQLTVWRAYNAPGGSATFSYTSVNTSGPTIALQEFTGAATSAAEDQTNGSSNNSSANPNLTITTSAPTTYAIAVIIDGRTADTVSAAGSGGPTWTMMSGCPVTLNGLVYAIATAPVASSSTTTGPAWTGVASGRTNELWTGNFKSAGSGTAYTLTAAQGSFGVTGSAAPGDYANSAAKGQFTMTGYTITGKVTRQVAAAQGAFGLTTFSAVLAKNGIPGGGGHVPLLGIGFSFLRPGAIG